MGFPERPAAYKDAWPLEVAIAACGRQSIQAIEINYSVFEPLDPPRQMAALEMLAAVGVKINSMHSPFSEPRALEIADRGQRLAGVDRTIRCLRLCNRCRIRRLVIHSSNSAGGNTQSERDNLCRSIEELLPVARTMNVILCLENMPPYHAFGWRPEDVAGVIAQFDDPYLRGVFDSGHANMAGPVLEIFEAMRPYIVHTHLHDNNRDRDLHLPPGYGTVPWPTLMPRLLDLDLDIPLFIEALALAKRGGLAAVAVGGDGAGERLRVAGSVAVFA